MNNKQFGWALSVVVIFIIFCVIMAIVQCPTAKGAWIPHDYQTWQDSVDTTYRTQIIGRGVHNYQKEDSSWAEIQDIWQAEGDTSWSALAAFIKTRVWKNGKSAIEIEFNGQTYRLTQTLKAIVFANIETDQKWVMDSSLNWTNSTVDSNSITWSNVTPGVNCKFIKRRGRVSHRIIFKPAFLDSAVVLYNQRTDSLDIALANVIVYKLTNLDNPDFTGHVSWRKFKTLGNYIFGLNRQHLFATGESIDSVDVMQQWYKKGDVLLCAEYVMMSEVKRLHELYPTEALWHNSDVSVYSELTDGVLRMNDEATYADAHDPDAAEQIDDDVGGHRLGQLLYESGYYVYRTYHYYNTSGIGAGQTIDSARAYFFVYQDWSATDFDIALVPIYAPTTLRVGHYMTPDSIGIAYDGVWNTSNFPSPDAYVFILVDDSTHWIEPEGTTKLGLRSMEDINSSEPANHPGGDERVDYYSAYNSSTSNDPYLQVWYHATGAPTGQVIIVD